MKNRMQEIAEMLGVELDEEFDVINQDCNLIYGCPYKLTHEGCELQTGDTASSTLMQLLNGNCSIVKKPWKPKYGERFYYINTEERVCRTSNYEATTDLAFIYFGNCFRSKEEAEANKDEMLEKMKEVMGDRYAE